MNGSLLGSAAGEINCSPGPVVEGQSEVSEMIHICARNDYKIRFERFSRSSTLPVAQDNRSCVSMHSLQTLYLPQPPGLGDPYDCQHSSDQRCTH